MKTCYFVQCKNTPEHNEQFCKECRRFLKAMGFRPELITEIRETQRVAPSTPPKTHTPKQLIML